MELIENILPTKGRKIESKGSDSVYYKSKDLTKERYNLIERISVLYSKRKYLQYPILDTRISSVRTPFVLRYHPLKSETGCTGKLWSNRVLLLLKN